MKANGEHPFYFNARDHFSEQTMERLLDEKLAEELREFQENPCPEEMADIVEVIYAIADHYGVKEEQLEATLAMRTLCDKKK